MTRPKLALLALILPLAACGSDPTGPGGAPGSVTVVAVSNARIRVNWVDEATDEAGYEIQRSTAGGPFVAVDTLPGGSTSLLDTGLPPLTLFRYRIRTLYASDASGFSTSDTVSTPAAPTLSAFTAAMVASVMDALNGGEVPADYSGPGYTMTVKGEAFCEPVDKNADPVAGNPPAGLNSWGCANAPQNIAVSQSSSTTVALVLSFAPFIDFAASDSVGAFGGYSWGGTATVEIDFALAAAPFGLSRLTSIQGVTQSSTPVVSLARATTVPDSVFAANVQDQFGTYAATEITGKLAAYLADADPFQLH